jgi:hypothetical protein
MASASWESNPWVWAVSFKVLKPGDWEAGPEEHPILFRGEMVRAILEARKTQTRRVVKDIECGADGHPYWPGTKKGGAFLHPSQCPYGKPGDRLWVRETWKVMDPAEADVMFAADEMQRRCLDSPDHWWRGKRPDARWRPSIHMPRWACRLVLEVTDVRVERLQDVSEEDAKAEGAVPYTPPHGCVSPHQRVPGPGFDGARLGDQPHRLAFADLWESIHG